MFYSPAILYKYSIPPPSYINVLFLNPRLLWLWHPLLWFDVWVRVTELRSENHRYINESPIYNIYFSKSIAGVRVRGVQDYPPSGRYGIKHKTIRSCYFLRCKVYQRLTTQESLISVFMEDPLTSYFMRWFASFYQCMKHRADCTRYRVQENYSISLWRIHWLRYAVSKHVYLN